MPLVFRMAGWRRCSVTPASPPALRKTIHWGQAFVLCTRAADVERSPDVLVVHREVRVGVEGEGLVVAGAALRHLLRRDDSGVELAARPRGAVAQRDRPLAGGAVVEGELQRFAARGRGAGGGGAKTNHLGSGLRS